MPRPELEVSLGDGAAQYFLGYAGFHHRLQQIKDKTEHRHNITRTGRECLVCWAPVCLSPLPAKALFQIGSLFDSLLWRLDIELCLTALSDSSSPLSCLTLDGRLKPEQTLNGS